MLINSKRFEIKDFVTFDVYTDNSIVMDTWINSSVTLDDIILIYTYDEASRMLAESSKKLFYDYGWLVFAFTFVVSWLCLKSNFIASRSKNAAKTRYHLLTPNTVLVYECRVVSELFSLKTLEFNRRVIGKMLCSL